MTAGSLASLDWEVLMPQPLAAHAQMALDEVLLTRVADGARGPTLRFWEWSERALVLGSHQVLANEVDLEVASAMGFFVARRMSGGGTMICEPGRTISYSLYAPEALVRGMSYVASFAFLDAWAVGCLRSLGVPAAYRPVNDIVSPGGKMGGAAQARRRGAVLHHTTIAHDIDPAIVPRLIRIGRGRVSPKGVRSAEKVVSPLKRYLGLDLATVVEALAACFAERNPVRRGAVSESELESAERLARSKYSMPEWLDRLR